ncbi:hypothetical protein TrST_g922 [Triparma strigata]|uniref:Uncharacterized protein n=1 Tax=Triparma strigata TaxID=1606541 RepID=A0A9W7C0I4_9STRA|nr:hypothetical protein TrST_g922 [Triparma strigata]
MRLISVLFASSAPGVAYNALLNQFTGHFTNFAQCSSSSSSSSSSSEHVLASSHEWIQVSLSPAFKVDGKDSKLAIYSFESDPEKIFRTRLYTFEPAAETDASNAASNAAVVAEMEIWNLPKDLQTELEENYKLNINGPNLPPPPPEILPSLLPSCTLIPGCKVTWSSVPSPDRRFEYFPKGCEGFHGTLPEGGVTIESQYSTLGLPIIVHDEISVSPSRIYINDRGTDLEGNVIYGRGVWDGKGPYLMDRVADGNYERDRDRLLQGATIQARKK